MKLERQSFLVLERLAKPSAHKVHIVQTLSEALLDWKPSMRISPIFAVDRPHAPSTSALRGRRRLLFIGPVHPDALRWAQRNSRLFVSLGLLNVLLLPNSRAEAAKLLKWAKEKGLLYEAWDLENGVVKKAVFSEAGAAPAELLKGLANLSSMALPPELSDAVGEYCPLMACTVSRGSSFPSAMLQDLRQIDNYVVETVRELKGSAGENTPYRVLGQLLSVNAGLSRFSSQTFAGTSPIMETECHFGQTPSLVSELRLLDFGT